MHVFFNLFRRSSNPLYATMKLLALLLVTLMHVVPAKIYPGHEVNWAVTPNSFCGLEDPVEWSVTFKDCEEKCAANPSCTEFAFTNNRWHGRTGCVYSTPCADPCTDGACGNWDTFDCPHGPCTPTPAPPGPAPTPPPSKFVLSPAMGSNMVLQRDTPASIYGTSGAGDNITVKINGVLETITRTLDNGTWAAVLKTRPASSTPMNITISSADTNSEAVLTNVLFGVRSPTTRFRTRMPCTMCRFGFHLALCAVLVLTLHYVPCVCLFRMFGCAGGSRTVSLM
jgi:hypothetical protein